jgi:hypothetical protein
MCCTVHVTCRFIHLYCTTVVGASQPGLCWAAIEFAAFAWSDAKLGYQNSNIDVIWDLHFNTCTYPAPTSHKNVQG